MRMCFKNKKFVWIMLVVVAVSLLFTGIIVMKITSEASSKVESYWFFRKSLETGQPVTIENAFLVSNSKGQLVFVHDNVIYQVDGILEADVFGVADILIDGDKIIKIYNKPDIKEGILESYTAETLSLYVDSESSEIDLKRNTNVPIYQVEGNTITQLDWNNLMIGISKIDCVMENGTVCAILIEEDVLPQDIRVIITNGASIFHDKLYIKKKSEGSVIDVSNLLNAQENKSMVFSDSNGIYICDSSGNEIGSAYEGEFKILRKEEGLILINTLPIETYLKYVVPSEMPISFGEEALKCQAVCARTYAYAQINNQTYAEYGANLDDTTSFQVYHSTGRYDETDVAVDATKGEVITRNGELITSYYYSTSPKDIESPFCSWNAYIDESKATDLEYGALQDIIILKKNEAGYATEVQLIYENGDRTISNEYKIRKELGNYVSEIVLSNEKVRTDLKTLPSSYFDVVITLDGRIVIKGGGFGHGIGMSQYGAKALDKAGYSYLEIIEFYYKNVLVKQL